MFAIDIKVSPLIPLSVFLAYSSAMLLLFENEGERATGLTVSITLSVILSAHAAHIMRSQYKHRVRRVVFTPTRSVLIYESEQPPRHASPPAVLRCGEFLIVLKFSDLPSLRPGVAGGRGSATVLRLWPGSLERPQASRLRAYIKSLEPAGAEV